MVYNFAQAHLRECLKENDETLPNQLGKQVKTPTMSWVFELMSTIAVVTISTNNQKQRIVTNLKPVHQQIIAYFGIHAQIIYGISDTELIPKTKYWNKYQKLNCQKLLN
jgi:hypothetical protein